MKSKKGLIASIVIAIIAILVLAGGLIYVKTDLFKPANMLFYKYLLGEKTKFNYDEFLEQIKNDEEKEYSSSGEISANIDSEATSTYARNNMNNISKFKVEFEQKSKPQEEKMASNIKLRYDNKDVISANLVKNADIYAVQSDIMNEKYIAVENNNLKDLAQKLGIDEKSIPDKFEQVKAYDLLYVSKDDRKEIVDKYKKVINNKISKDKYSTEKKVETEINGEKIKTSTYKLTTTEKEIYETIKSMLETAKEDEKLQELIISKYEMINKNGQDNEELTKDNIKEKIEELISDIDKKLKSASEDSVDIIVYVNKGKTVKIEVKENESLYSIEFFEKDNKNNIVVLTNVENKEDKLNIEYEIKEENDSKNVIGTITILSENKEQVKINYEITQKGKKGKGKNELTAKFNIESDGSKMELNIKENVNYDEKITIEDLDNDNMVKLNDMSEEEIKNLFTEVYQKAVTEFPKIMEETGISELFSGTTSSLNDDNDDNTYNGDYDENDYTINDEEDNNSDYEDDNYDDYEEDNL